MKNKQISIIGSGWLGTPLAQHFLSLGHTVKASSTSIEKKATLTEQGMVPYIFKLGEKTETSLLQDFLKDSEWLIINFPPKRIPDIETIYSDQIKAILPYINPTQKVLFVSSTSVYQNTNDWVTETLAPQPEKASGKAVFAVENLLKATLQDRLTILRFAGLIGYDRLPGRFLANKKNVANGKAPINIIHRDDCIGLIDCIVTTNCTGVVLNGCADEHPLREVFYSLAAKRIQMEPPTFLDSDTIAFKKISNTKSKEVLKYTYKYPDPLKLI
ncbi:NAD(P)-binding domain-containing protein [Aquimarina rhabdastrellae]